MNAMTTPCDRRPAWMSIPPAQRTSTTIRFTVVEVSGLNSAETRPMARPVPVSSPFARRKRADSRFVLANARITRTPARFWRRSEAIRSSPRWYAR